MANSSVAIVIAVIVSFLFVLHICNFVGVGPFLIDEEFWLLLISSNHVLRLGISAKSFVQNPCCCRGFNMPKSVQLLPDPRSRSVSVSS